ncbi:MAG: metal-sensing transcriptional repressor [Clostridia bacterium]|nr:metal-sensing transcriptional repressor [Clostridia bacterium]
MNDEKLCPCQSRKKHRSEEERTALMHRLNRIEGQIRGIRNMVGDDAYCTDILTQVAAATAALNAFGRELLAEHIRTCVADDLRAGNGECVDELLHIIQKLMK